MPGNRPAQKFTMKPIHILVDSLADESLTNAQMINAREIVRRLDARRFAVTMFVCANPDPRIIARPNTQLVQLPRRRQTLRVLRQFLFGRQDILFYLKASPAARWYLELRRAIPGSCIVVGSIESQTDWCDETIIPQAIRLIEATILRSDYLFSNSAFVQRSLKKNYELKSDVIPTGVDTEFFTPNGEACEHLRPRVLFVGALRTFKQPQVVLDAAQRFPQADFVIVGDGVMAEALRQRARFLSNVTLRGSLSRTAIREEYRNADIFLFPSRWEGSPRVLMEAAASGLPVIARRDYEPETVIDGVTGFLGTTDEELMGGLAQLLANPELRRRFGHCGRSHVGRYSWDAIARQWESVFVRLVERAGKL